MELLEVSATPDKPADFLARAGQVFATFDARTQDSGNVSYGVRTSRGTFFVKTAGAPSAEAPLPHARRVAWLRNAVRVNGAVQDPALCVLRHVVESAHGPLLVYDWVSGELVRTASAARTDPASAFMRFKALPLAALASALSAVFRVHGQLCARGWVACDFYDGALMYDFDAHELKLVDLDMYHEGPFINDRGRMFGSDRFMAPEEFELGARIDERTTVFTMGRCIAVFLGEREPRTNPAALLDMLEVGKRACQAEREQRWSSMAELYEAWLRAVRGL
jgi:hypothetical protein